MSLEACVTVENEMLRLLEEISVLEAKEQYDAEEIVTQIKQYAQKRLEAARSGYL